MNTIKLNKTNSPKELYVRVFSLASKKNADVDISRIKEEYDNEESRIKHLNLFSGGGLGASVGLIACFAIAAVGVPMSSPEVFTLVGGSLLFGVVAGFILY
ncbi:MAG: hypothetical protein ABH860_06215 [bacterium]